MQMNPILADLLALPEDVRNEVLAGFTEAQLLDLVYDWKLWARPAQLVPDGDWSTWCILAGRGFGKTRTGAETIRNWMCGTTPMGRGLYRRCALIAETAADARDVLVEGESGLLSTHSKAFMPLYEPSKRKLTWPNGAEAHIYNATEPDQLRGPQHDCAWGDELAKWAYARETWDQLQFGMRLGRNPRVVITTTPRPIPVLLEILKEEGTVVTKGSTMDNSANLSSKFIEKIHKRYAGTRLGRQELEAEVLTDLPGALWTRNLFDPIDGSGHLGRVRNDALPDLRRIVVGVDPSGTKGGSDDGDAIGIIVSGVDDQETPHAYVLADLTIKGSPKEWAAVAVWAYKHFKADRIVAETNFGGAMVEDVLRQIDPNIPYREVKASRGKIIRAEPAAALYEQGRVHHVIGANPKDEEDEGLGPLEDQLCQMAPSGFSGDGSPDRADALVWTLFDLLIEEQEGYTTGDMRRAYS